jgi:hypothetical protein
VPVVVEYVDDAEQLARRMVKKAANWRRRPAPP